MAAERSPADKGMSDRRGDLSLIRRPGRPLSDAVYEMVRDDIVDGVLPPGASLVQEALGQAYGVSRSPIRDLLNRLVFERLVTLMPGGGYVVADLPSDLIKDIFAVRQGLELMALQDFGATFGEVELAQLAVPVVEAEQLTADDIPEFFEIVRRFHLMLVAPCRNQYLLDTLTTVWDNPLQRRIARTRTTSQAKIREVAAVHRNVFRAAQKSDLAELTRLLAYCHRADA